jgi:hypothetical protein
LAFKLQAVIDFFGAAVTYSLGQLDFAFALGLALGQHSLALMDQAGHHVHVVTGRVFVK